jgi:SAM-dependent methyltransferase
MIRFRRTRIKLRILYSRLRKRPREVVRRHQFNLWAENGWADFLDSPHLALTEKAVKDMNLAPGARVLDLACGGGLASRMIAGIAGERSLVVGADISDEIVGRARAKSKQFKNVKFICSSADHVPVSDNFFSHIVCIEAFYYFEDPETALRELLRVTAPQGRISIVVCLYTDHALSLHTVDDVDVPVQVRSVAEYKQLMESAGWSEVNLEDHVWPPRPGRKPNVHDRALFITARKAGDAHHSWQAAETAPQPSASN